VSRVCAGYAAGVSDFVRPDPFHWLLYAFGAGLPERNREWVLHDVTARTWFLRHLGRAVLQIVPIAVVLYLLLPMDPTIKLSAIAMGALMGLIYSGAFAWGATAHRAVKAGYPEGLVEELRGRPDAARR
jgi:Family of unknown function (DUF5313)